MRLGRCPICHSHIDLYALVQDEAGRELLGVLAKMDTNTGTALVGYLSLFRSEKRDLANDRALRLYKACDELAQGDWQRLAIAMHQQIEQVQAKIDAGAKRQQFKNHNYLKKIFEDVAPSHAANVMPSGTNTVMPAKQGQPSKTAKALGALEAMKEAMKNE